MKCPRCQLMIDPPIPKKDEHWLCVQDRRVYIIASEWDSNGTPATAMHHPDGRVARAVWPAAVLRGEWIKIEHTEDT